MTLVHRSRRLLLAGGLLLVTMALAAPALAVTIAVSIDGKTFVPADIVITEGDTVTWTVTKSISEPHTVTSGTAGDAATGAAFDSKLENGSKLQENGATFSFTFKAVGNYPYFCQIHPDMKGTVTVHAAGGAPGEAEAGIPMQNRLIGAGILIVTLVVLFGAAIAWRRMNPA
jgi:plastocyanin